MTRIARLCRPWHENNRSCSCRRNLGRGHDTCFLRLLPYDARVHTCSLRYMYSSSNHMSASSAFGKLSLVAVFLLFVRNLHDTHDVLVVASCEYIPRETRCIMAALDPWAYSCTEAAMMSPSKVRCAGLSCLWLFTHLLVGSWVGRGQQKRRFRPVAH